MKFNKTGEKRTPPTQGYTTHRYDIEDGPSWEEGVGGSWRKPPTRYITHRIVKLVVTVYDDGTTAFQSFENKIKKNGEPYDQRPSKVWRWRGPDGPSKEMLAEDQAIEAFRRSDEYPRT